MLHFLKINLSRETVFAPEKRSLCFLFSLAGLSLISLLVSSVFTLYEVANPNFHEGVLIFFRKALFSVFQNVSIEYIKWNTKNCFHARVVFPYRDELNILFHKKKQEIMN